MKEEAGRSRTSDIPAIMRAAHQSFDDEPRILADPIAPLFVDIAALDPWLAALFVHPFARQWRAEFALRSRYAEDCLADCVARGVDQYAILGAGLDTFAYRQPEWGKRLSIFELDHPATQRDKQARLARARVAAPRNLTFVSADFERETLRSALAASRFSFDRPTCFSCLGVMQYLTLDAVEATFAFVLSLPPSTEIIFSVILPQCLLSGLEAEAMAAAAAKAGEVGEPWLSRFEPAELIARLRNIGFREVVHLTPEEAQRRYFRGRRDGLAPRRGEQLMRAVV